LLIAGFLPGEGIEGASCGLALAAYLVAAAASTRRTIGSSFLSVVSRSRCSWPGSRWLMLSTYIHTATSYHRLPTNRQQLSTYLLCSCLYTGRLCSYTAHKCFM